MQILVINSSGRGSVSVSRQLVAVLTDKLTATQPGAQVVYRDVAAGLPLVNDLAVSGLYIRDADRTPAQRESLQLSDTLVAELQGSDTVVVGMPIYNFGLPASLKAYVDLICRAGLTFSFTETGPVGLLTPKKVYVVVTSGGTEVGSAYDFATPHLRAILGFLGLTDVEFIPADQFMLHGEAPVTRAHAAIHELQLELA